MIGATFKINLSNLDSLRKGAVRTAIRIGMSRAASPVKAAVMSNAPQRYGYLSKAIRIKLKILDNNNAYVVIGPSRSVIKTKGKYKRGPRIGQPRKFIPANIAHLVDRGTSHAPAHPFLQRSLDSTFDQYVSSVNEEVGKEIRKVLSH